MINRGLTITEQTKIATYRRDPVLYVKHELGETPSPDQASLLRDVADLDKKYFIICAGRGAGKTKVVSWIVDWSESILVHYYPTYNVSVLGGSREQSQRLYDYVRWDVYKTPLLEKQLRFDPTKTYSEFMHGMVQTHAASSTSVRGPHPELLVLDEAAEIAEEIFYEALLMATGSYHGRIIILSTPHQFFGPFQDFWENAKIYEYERYGPWPLTDCPWQDKNFLKILKRQLTPQQYSVEVLGEFPEFGELLFSNVWIENCIAPEPFSLDKRHPMDTGVDWGYTQAETAVVPAQYYQGKIQLPGPDIVYTEPHYPSILRDIAVLHRDFDGQTSFCDSSDMAANSFLEDEGVTVYPISFARSKQLMQMNLQFLLYHNRLNISPDNKVLIEQLRKYRTESVRRKIGKQGEDSVDALMMVALQFADPRLQRGEMLVERKGDRFILR